MKHPDLSLPVQALQTGAMTQAQAGKGYNVDTVMADMVNNERRPEDLSKEVAETFSAIAEISGKSTRTLHSMLSLINLPDYIRTAISEGTLPVSQGYLFAANLDCPDLEKIFENVMKTPVTNAVLNNMFSAYKQPKPEPVKPKPPSLTQKVSSLQRTTPRQSSWYEMKSAVRTLIRNKLRAMEPRGNPGGRTLRRAPPHTKDQNCKSSGTSCRLS